jgi:hypothetical protein
MHREALARELRTHRINQERHVVVDDRDDRAPRLGRVRDRDLGGTRLALGAMHPERRGRGVKLVAVPPLEIAARDVRVELVDEAGERRTAGERGRGLDHRGLRAEMALVPRESLGWFVHRFIPEARHLRHPVLRRAAEWRFNASAG